MISDNNCIEYSCKAENKIPAVIDLVKKTDYGAKKIRNQKAEYFEDKTKKKKSPNLIIK